MFSWRLGMPATWSSGAGHASPCSPPAQDPQLPWTSKVLANLAIAYALR